MAAPSVLSKAPYPNNIMGVWAFLSLAKNGWVPSAISYNTLVVVPKCKYSYVRSDDDPITATFKLFFLVAFKILLLKTGDSNLGFDPTINNKSESSTPYIVEFIR